MSIKNRVTLSGNINSRVNLSENLQNTFLKGVGIEEAHLNPDYTLTLTFTDGSSYTTPPIRGAQGEQGIQGETGEAGQDGHSPVITASKAGNVTTVYVDGTAVATISDGADGKDGKDGADGQDGAPGADGKDGVSPSVTVTAITGGHTIAITDATKTVTFTVLDGIDGQDGANGQDGADGHSPVVTASKSGKVTTVSVDGTAIATINDGEDGQNGATGDSGVHYGSSAPSGDENVWIDPTGNPDPIVTDVKINGSSIVSGGEAVIPLGSHNDYGVVKPGNGLGLAFTTSGALAIAKSNSNQIKSGASDYAVIVPANQHTSVFYGLAKLAGADMASSDNAVGTFTDAAKVAIQKMLGVYDPPFRLINTVTITEAVNKVYVNSDTNGDSFALKEVIIFLDNVAADNNDGTGSIGVNNGNNFSGTGKPYLFLQNMFMTTAKTIVINMSVRGGRFFAEGSIDELPQEYSRTDVRSSRNAMGMIECDPIYEICIGSPNAFKYTSGTITVYGR